MGIRATLSLKRFFNITAKTVEIMRDHNLSDRLLRISLRKIRISFSKSLLRILLLTIPK
jgi:hypothetical protein